MHCAGLIPPSPTNKLFQAVGGKYTLRVKYCAVFEQLPLLQQQESGRCDLMIYYFQLHWSIIRKKG